MKEYLKDGPKKRDEVLAAAKQRKIAMVHLIHAKSQLEITAKKRRGLKSPRYWCLPGQILHDQFAELPKRESAKTECNDCVRS